MPNVMGAMDGTHICITKIVCGFLENYYYHKIGRYNIVAEVVVDN
jgi:hypothetical protein